MFTTVASVSLINSSKTLMPVEALFIASVSAAMFVSKVPVVFLLLI